MDDEAVANDSGCDDCRCGGCGSLGMACRIGGRRRDARALTTFCTGGTASCSASDAALDHGNRISSRDLTRELAGAGCV